ncbi:DEAD/DEAH box helicase [Siphonobacter sp. SORGH_AS_1065]|uniref:DEAD/DEAH box helicase n=1 Tax=Siphonobacter sp. SORGH_AS_1065 TaxID=3041795 RepID=UPI00277E6FD7|nr:DEAD/DEAH box helicase [Siphonobacter sp. SORGH_AS_1065]MDQ1090043.1 hypothetical protein [Siphonobacter sp. SORGH_AS_1065]
MHDFVLIHTTIPALSESQLIRYSLDFNHSDLVDILPQTLKVNEGVFNKTSRANPFPSVRVSQTEDSVQVSCSCNRSAGGLCDHEVQVLMAIKSRKELLIFFDSTLRQNEMRRVAEGYGLENEENLEDYFELEYTARTYVIKPLMAELFPVTPQSTDELRAILFPDESFSNETITRRIVVFSKPRFQDRFVITLHEAAVTKQGKLKNPISVINPLDVIEASMKEAELKAYTSLAKFQNPHRLKREAADIDSLKFLLDLNLEVYYHDPRISENINAPSLFPIQLKKLPLDLTLSVHKQDVMYQIKATLDINHQSFSLEHLRLRYEYFLEFQGSLLLIDHVQYLRIITVFKQKNHALVIHQSRFEDFRNNLLISLENRVKVKYSYLKPATPRQREESGFDEPPQRLIYLTDSDQYISLMPVLKYGSLEVPILSQRQIYGLDPLGNPFTLERDEEAEIAFTSLILSQHPNFMQHPEEPYYQLTKGDFLDELWILDAWEYWQQQGITVLGFNTLKNNRLNPNKAKISVHVTSGISWFETSIGVYFGKQRVSLKHLHQAVKNRNRFVKLDDGTQGLLPQEWLEKFARYFQSGEVVKETLHTPKVHYADIRTMYEEEVLDSDVMREISLYESKFANLSSRPAPEIPASLNASLRDYQKQGVHWLQILDELGFGGCLADDMGLGKTLQVITFLLLQKNQRPDSTSLIVVPTSLLANWQNEVARFAPSLGLKILYGPDRIANTQDFLTYDIILTTYGTLVSDVHYLKNFAFNYLILDESQAIKNPDSQRYKAARLLQSRNKLVLTGTPIENHTFDLYGQLSFACPGLLGSYTYFKEHYSMPIDRYQDRKRADELHEKINPFVLRRTKAQVASELPDKTEMVIFCEMGSEQRRVYTAFEQEFRHFLLTKKEGDLPRRKLRVLQGLTKLRQICDSPILVNDEEYYGNHSAKIDTLIEQIEERAPDHKILVFSQFVSMLELIRTELEQRGIGYEYLTGQTRNRAERVNRFQENEDVRVFLISLKAGGTGLNLTRADYVYLVDPWWNPAVENQAIDRCYRIGQKKNVVAVRLICPDTIEEKILQLQQNKTFLAQGLIKAQDVESWNTDDLLKLFQ